MSYHIGFGQSYTKMGQKMTCDRPLFWALLWYKHTLSGGYFVMLNGYSLTKKDHRPVPNIPAQ